MHWYTIWVKNAIFVFSRFPGSAEAQVAYFIGNISTKKYQNVGFSNFLLRKLSCEFKLREMSILREFQMAIFPYCLRLRSQWSGVHCAGSPICIAHAGMTLTWSKVKVKVTGLLKFRKWHFSTSISSAISACHGAQNWWLITTVWDLVYSFSEPHFWICLPVGGHVTSKFAKCWYDQNPLHFISTLPEARSLWLWLQVGRTSRPRWWCSGALWYNICTAVSRKNIFTHTRITCSPHLNNALTLPCDTETSHFIHL